MKPIPTGPPTSRSRSSKRVRDAVYSSSLEDAGVVQLVEQPQEVGRVLGRVVARPSRAAGAGRRAAPRGLLLLERHGHLRADRLGVDPGALKPLAVLLDADAALGEAVGLRAPEGALLHEAAVADHERDRDDEARRCPSRPDPLPTIAKTIPAPISVPTSPMRIVSHAGIGSGPGTANRASAPVKKAVTITEMMLPSMPGA